MEEYERRLRRRRYKGGRENDEKGEKRLRRKK